MRCEPLTKLLRPWASALLGFLLFLAIGIQGPVGASFALPGALAWLALLGSLPTMLVIVTAERVGESGRAALLFSVVAVAAVVGAASWPHTDWLLSGPEWLRAPNRTLLRATLSAVLGVLGAATFGWTVAGSRAREARSRWAWAMLSLVAIAVLTMSLFRYRAYDQTSSWVVVVGGVLCAAVVQQMTRRPRLQRVSLAAAIGCTLVGGGSWLLDDFRKTGEREVIAHSRAGALAMLHVLPRLEPDIQHTVGPTACEGAGEDIERAVLDIDPAQRRNVLIITVDALRKDVVGASEQGTRVTPALDGWTERGVSFERATTTYPATLYAIGSAFTGLSPAELYLSPRMPNTIFTRARGRVDRQLVVLPDVSWFRLPIVVDFLAPGTEVDLVPGDASATRAMIARLRAARAAGDSVMGWIHYYSPHDPYVPHASSAFGDGTRNAYLGEVSYADRQVGELLEYLEADDWLDDTLVIFFSDHGEALGEQRYFGHHVYLNAWMIDVPLVLWHAELGPLRSEAGASVADVAPTVLHFLGLPSPQGVGSQSLFTLDDTDRDRASYSEAFAVRGAALFDSFRLPSLEEATIRDRITGIRVASHGYEPKGAISRGRARLIHHRSSGATFFYRTDEDGTERRVPGAQGSEEALALWASLQEWEAAQLDRLRCRLRLSADEKAPRGPR